MTIPKPVPTDGELDTWAYLYATGNNVASFPDTVEFRSYLAGAKAVRTHMSAQLEARDKEIARLKEELEEILEVHRPLQNALLSYERKVSLYREALEVLIDGDGMVRITAEGQKSEEYFGKINVSIEPKVAKKLAEALKVLT